jgi:hypothetical protein
LQKLNAMKKLLLLLIIITCFSFVQGQEISFGLKGGVNFSKVDGKGMAKTFNEGYGVGVYAMSALYNRWALQVEMEYNPTDINASTDFRTYYITSSRSDFNKKSRLYKLNLPVLINYSLSDRIVLQLGPQYSYAIAIDESLLKNNQSAFSKHDFALIAGCQLNARSFFANLRYQYGVKNINAISNYYNWYSRQVQLGFGIRLFASKGKLGDTKSAF